LKPVSLNQLLFHPKSNALSLYLSGRTQNLDQILSELKEELKQQDKNDLLNLLEINESEIKKIYQRHANKSHGFFLSQDLQGYFILENQTTMCQVIGDTFHTRPILEEVYANPEFMVVNVSLYDIKVYRGDFHHLELINHFEFDQLPKTILDTKKVGFYTPRYLGLMPFKTLQALRIIANKIQETVLYNSLPIIVTGLSEVKNIFLKFFNQASGVISHLHEDFYEKTCIQVLESCKFHRDLILDFYSGQLKDRLKKMANSKIVLNDLSEIINATRSEKVLHLVLPTQSKLWGKIDLAHGSYELHQKFEKNRSVDILNELAQVVLKQGGKIQFLRHQFFPENHHALAIIKGT
jgi:hypothetical protein